MTKTRSFLKWPGNKYQCLAHILSSLPKAKRLIEPFTGSGALFINTDYPSYLLGEANPDLINIFQYLQNEGQDFISYCQAFFIPQFNKDLEYYRLREDFNTCQEPRLRAALFLYLNRHGYNGLCRYNSKGVYNVPFGLYSKPYFPLKEMQHFHRRSQKASFIQQDFRQTFALAEKGDIIYCDPPYVPLSKSAKFSAYVKTKFTEADHIDLAVLAKETARKGITVIVSNHDTEFTREQYHTAKIKSFPVARLISCKIENRRAVKELLAIFK